MTVIIITMTVIVVFMVKTANSKKDQKLYQCSECRLHYQDQATAEECEAWCKKHKSCNLEIIKNSIENRTLDS